MIDAIGVLSDAQKTKLIENILTTALLSKDDLYLDIRNLVLTNREEKIRIENLNLSNRYWPVDYLENTYNYVPENITYGVEIECLISPDKYEELKLMIAKSSKSMDFISIKDIINSNKPNVFNAITSSDGSLRRRRTQMNKVCIEIKTQILSGDKGLEEIENIIRFLNPSFNETCGIHLHVQRKEKWERVNLFVPLFDNIIMPFFSTSKRFKSNMFCNRYKSTLWHIGSNEASIEAYIDNILKLNFRNHYCATSISGKFETIEFRHMHGHKNIQKIKEFISLITNMCAMLYDSKYSDKYLYDFTNQILTVNGKYQPSIEHMDGYRTNYKIEAFTTLLEKVFGEN